jgi:hypothetical protein
MNTIDAPSLLTIIYELVDDWYQKHGYQFDRNLLVRQPQFSNSEMLTLLLAMDYFSYSIGLWTNVIGSVLKSLT